MYICFIALTGGKDTTFWRKDGKIGGECRVGRARSEAFPPAFRRKGAGVFLRKCPPEAGEAEYIENKSYLC